MLAATHLGTGSKPCCSTPRGSSLGSDARVLRSLQLRRAPHRLVAATPIVQTPYSSISISNASQLHLKPRDVSSAAATGPDWVHAGHGVVKKGEVPSSFAAASEELARLATPGSVWPAEARAAVEAVATKLGGLFFVVVCGTFAEPHPRAGQPAYSLFQMVFVAVTAATANEQTPYSVGRSPVVVHALRAPGDMPLPMLHIIAYELDSDGWPKAAAYNSATAFEKLTDRAGFKKVLGSTKIMFMGVPVFRPLTLFGQQLKPLGVALPPMQMRRLLADWGYDQLAAAGIQVLSKSDAITIARTNPAERTAAKRERRGSARARAQAARAVVQTEGAGQQLPPGKGAADSDTSGYPR